MTTTISTEFDARIEMKAFIDRSRAPYGDWYAGVTADPDQRIEEHGLQSSDWFIVRRLATAEAARRVAESLLKLGCGQTPARLDDGGEAPAEDDEACTFVYTYWKRGHTTP